MDLNLLENNEFTTNTQINKKINKKAFTTEQKYNYVVQEIHYYYNEVLNHNISQSFIAELAKIIYNYCYLNIKLIKILRSLPNICCITRFTNILYNFDGNLSIIYQVSILDEFVFGSFIKEMICKCETNIELDNLFNINLELVKFTKHISKIISRNTINIYKIGTDYVVNYNGYFKYLLFVKSKKNEFLQIESLNIRLIKKCEADKIQIIIKYVFKKNTIIFDGYYLYKINKYYILLE